MFYLFSQAGKQPFGQQRTSSASSVSSRSTANAEALTQKSADVWRAVKSVGVQCPESADGAKTFNPSLSTIPSQGEYLGQQQQPQRVNSLVLELDELKEKEEEAQYHGSRLRRLLCRRRDVLTVIVYFISGCLFFGLGPMKWTVGKSLYYLIVTVTTVGYGDIVPTDDVSRGIAIVYIFVGLIVIFPILAESATLLIQSHEEKMLKFSGYCHSPAHARCFFSVLIILTNIAIGMTFFIIQEAHLGDWDGLDAVWWTIATVTTIGYGDQTFDHGDRCRWFLVVYIPVSVILVGASLANLARAADEMRAERREKELLDRMDMAMLKKLDPDGDGIDKAEYVLGMLQMMELVDKEKIRMYEHQFHEHDKDGSGKLTEEDLVYMQQEHSGSLHEGKAPDPDSV
mmetsp:Transcript_14333/g.45203  ORF Transcript_14333/g.45203 Transcript_14333/m.45203 type:complete len:399 (+) Transcript_14333:85-1281(+)